MLYLLEIYLFRTKFLRKRIKVEGFWVRWQRSLVIKKLQSDFSSSFLIRNYAYFFCSDLLK